MTESFEEHAKRIWHIIDEKEFIPYQLCPKCCGTGLIVQLPGWPISETIVSSGPYTCDVCNGAKTSSFATK